MNKTLIWAHRGVPVSEPENTLEGFRLAIELGADGIELDVHETADGKLAVIHDGSIERVSNGTGEVAKMTLDELRAFDFGKQYPGKHAHVAIPTLEEVYDLMAPSALTVNVEIKNGTPAIYQKLYRCMIDHGMTGRIIYSSFNHRMLEEMKKVDADAYIAPLYGGGIPKPWLYGAYFHCTALHMLYTDLYTYPGYLEGSRETGILLNPWTVDSEEDINRMLDMHVNAIITNNPALAIKLRDARN